MNIQETEAFIKKVSEYGSILGLDSIKRLCSELQDPQKELKVIHISGTNGKGSVGAFLNQILTEAGYLVGRFSSPAVFNYEEMFQIRSEAISKERLAALYTQVEKACEAIVTKGFLHPTIFEVETAAAFLLFREEACDIAIVEVGMGGELDATNVIEQPVCSVITSISMDHMAFLGYRIEQIALAKAGIIKTGRPVICASQLAVVSQAIEQEARKKNALFYQVDDSQLICEEEKSSLEGLYFSYKDSHDMLVHLIGLYQLENAALAMETARVLEKEGYLLTKELVRSGLEHTIWKGRMECIADNPCIYMDGAHNPGAAVLLRKTIELYFTNRRIIYIIGVLGDKDHESVLREMAAFSDCVFTITPDNPRGLDAKKLAVEAKKYYGQVESAENMEEALKKAISMCHTSDDMILAFGSLSFLKELENAAAKLI